MNNNTFGQSERGTGIAERVKSHLPTATTAVAILGLIAGISQQARETSDPNRAKTQKVMAQQKDAGGDPMDIFLATPAAPVLQFPQYKVKVEKLLSATLALLPYHKTTNSGCERLSEIPLNLRGARWNMRIEGIKYETNPFVGYGCTAEHPYKQTLKFMLKKQSGLKDEMIITYAHEYIGITNQQFNPRTNKPLTPPIDSSHARASDCNNFDPFNMTGTKQNCTNEKDLPYMNAIIELIDKALQKELVDAKIKAAAEEARKKAQEERIKNSVLHP